MNCIHINVKRAVFILLTFFANNIDTADNAIKPPDAVKIQANTSDEIKVVNLQNLSIPRCPTGIECRDLPAYCIDCDLNETCVYGREMTSKCQAKNHLKCFGQQDFEKRYICRYCYQTEHWEHDCEVKATCESSASPQKDVYITNCTVNSNILCLGHRTFKKKVKCNWTGGYRWSTALVLSITLGGFGADRFYLGHWQEGIGKLFSFGGLGVWTLIDVILISLHYLGPGDGSLYL